MSISMFGFDDPAGRVIVACVVPYNEIETVTDRRGRHEEMFLPHAFGRQVEQSTAQRIWLNVEHGDDVIGHVAGLRNFGGCLSASLRVWDGAVGDNALAMVRNGEFRGVSMEAHVLCSRTVDSVTKVSEAHLTAVSLARTNHAYWAARIVGIRGDRPNDLPGPSSPAELRSWQLDWEEDLVKRLIVQRIDENTRSYTHDPDYQALNRTLERISEERSELEAAIAIEAPADASPRPRPLHRDCDQIVAGA
jgi:hypothetical protein